MQNNFGVFNYWNNDNKLPCKLRYHEIFVHSHHEGSRLFLRNSCLCMHLQCKRETARLKPQNRNLEHWEKYLVHTKGNATRDDSQRPFSCNTALQQFGGGSRVFFRRGCTRLLLYFNTNKPHTFFCRIPVVLENRRSSQGGCAPPAPSP